MPKKPSVKKSEDEPIKKVVKTVAKKIIKKEAISDSEEDLSEDDKVKPTKVVKKVIKKIAKEPIVIESDDDDSNNDSDDSSSDSEEEKKDIKGSKTKKKKEDPINVDSDDESTTTKLSKKGKYILVIVESPGKIKKLESILGAGYKVTSSFGHLMDLHPVDLSVDLDNNFKPEYYVMSGEHKKKKTKFDDKRPVVKELRRLAASASEVILASDKDREGEMIAWSYMKLLGLKDAQRIVFTSITKEAIKKAIKSPEKINIPMVESQKARRILDRITGWKISPVLTKTMGMRNLSAGRVQSILVRLICEREQEIIDFFKKDESSYFKFIGMFKTIGGKKAPVMELKSELYSDTPMKLIEDEVREEEDQDDLLKEEDEAEVKPKTKGKAKTKAKPKEEEDKEDKDQSKRYKAQIVKYETAKALLKSISKSTFKIRAVTKRSSKRYPSAPYATSDAQQDASSRLGFSTKRTMTALQALYEAGLTTYLRTDSNLLSDDAMTQCESFITDKFGDEYYNRKVYGNKKANTQEAHEAIRPVDITKRRIEPSGKIGEDEVKMYDLVWKRTVASQMKPADVDIYSIEIGISKEDDFYFLSSIEDVTFPGYLSVYSSDYDEKDHVKPVLPIVNQGVDAVDVKGSQEYLKPFLRYSEAGLVKKMNPKNLNIGRPATYASLIETIKERKYVEVKDVKGITKKSKFLKWDADADEISEETKDVNLGKENKKFCPTDLGMRANTVMLANFKELMEYKFTSDMEKKLDSVAEGDIEWTDVLQEFWDKLKPIVETLQNKTVVKDVKQLGVHPVTKNPIRAYMNYHGNVVEMARDAEGKDIVIAPIKPPYNLNTLTLDQALEILRYPKLVGTDKGMNVEIKVGEYGKYISKGVGKGAEKVSLSGMDDDEIDEIDIDKALELLEKKNEVKQERINSYLYYHKEGNYEYIVNNGKKENNRYLMVRNITKPTAKPEFCSFPVDQSLEKITFKRIKEIHAEQKAKRPATRSKTAKAKTNSDSDKSSIKRKVTRKTVPKKMAAQPTMKKLF